MNANPRRKALREVAAVFLKLGTIGFGGPAAHIALMEEEVVTRRNWVSKQQFLDLLSASNLIPGPNSTELAIHLGHARAGFPGLLTAGLAFILPATLIVMGVAWGYERYGALPEAAAVFHGIKPVIIAIVAQALWRLGQTAIKSRLLAVIGVLGAAALLWGIHELVVLFGTGLLVCLLRRSGRKTAEANWTFAALAPAAARDAGAATATAAAVAGVAVPFGLMPLFLFFLKVGSVLFGSGYVLLAFLRADLVERLQWLSETQLLDAVAIGQFTPGPLFTTATFIGYLLGGTPGALVATAGIFLPAFVFVAATGPFISHLRSSPTLAAFLDGVNVASLALMAVVSVQLGLTAIIDLPTAILAIASGVALFRFRVNSVWLVLAGGLIGFCLTRF